VGGASYHPSRLKEELIRLRGGGGEEKVVAHVDMDCFYVQVESRLNTTLKGIPCAVVQYNPFHPGGVRSISPSENRVVNGNGSIIAVSYEARTFGIKRGMRADQARKLFPELVTVQVPTNFGKSQLGIYRDCGAEVARVLKSGGPLERGSVDEVYLDVSKSAKSLLRSANALNDQLWEEKAEGPELKISPLSGWRCGDERFLALLDEAKSGHVAGLSDEKTHQYSKDQVSKGVNKNTSEQSLTSLNWWERPRDCWIYSERLLVAGAVVVGRLRDRVRRECNFTCSAGIAHNKLLSKLASAIHKPNSQTVVPLSCVYDLLRPLPIARIRGLGGKIGRQLQEDLNVTSIGELAMVPMASLVRLFGDRMAIWIWQASRGIDGEEVKDRILPKSLVTGKGFSKGREIHSIGEATHWVYRLCEDLHSRILLDSTRYQRIPTKLSLAICTPDTDNACGAVTRQCILPMEYNISNTELKARASDLLSRWIKTLPSNTDNSFPHFRIFGLFASVGNFVSSSGVQNTLDAFIKTSNSNTKPVKDEKNTERKSDWMKLSPSPLTPSESSQAFIDRKLKEHFGSKFPGFRTSNPPANISDQPPIISHNLPESPGPPTHLQGSPMSQSHLPESPRHLSVSPEGSDGREPREKAGEPREKAGEPLKLGAGRRESGEPRGEAGDPPVAAMAGTDEDVIKGILERVEQEQELARKGMLRQTTILEFFSLRNLYDNPRHPENSQKLLHHSSEVREISSPPVTARVRSNCRRCRVS